MTSTYQHQSDFVRYYSEDEAKDEFEGRVKALMLFLEAKGRVKGEVEGTARALLRVLAARGIDVPEDVRARITACTDLDQLETWIDRAVTATTLDDIFD